jgi:hypothetical protein
MADPMVCVPIFPEDPYPTAKMPCNKSGCLEFPFRNLAGFRHMQAKFLLPIGLLAAVWGTPALALRVPGQDRMSAPLQYPGAPKPVYDEHDSPYAMTYAEEAAQNLGFRDGHMDVFSTGPDSSGYLPSFSGGVGRDGAMLWLKWHPGE